MLRELWLERGGKTRGVFKQRGADVSRIEGFSDAVFGFALTLLVVAQQVPHSFAELLITLRGFFGFAFCFLVLATIWYRHYQFFRRYGLQDPFTVLLNSILLFVVLFFVYPLKFLADFLVNRVLGLGSSSTIHLSQLPLIFDCYFAGFSSVCLLFALLYAHAYRSRFALGLDTHEACETQIAVINNLIPLPLCIVAGLMMSLTHSYLYTPLAVSYTVVTAIGLSQAYRRLHRWKRRILAEPPVPVVPS